ncbi:MAG: hypothetical protein ACK5NT_03960 [Pyrinomonadaceae bacterium]
MLRRQVFLAAITFVLVAFIAGCGVVSAIRESTFNAVGLNEEGTIISKSCYIRSSYAVVAADLLELKRGQLVDILSETEFDGVTWYRVAANDEDQTEGWIEAQHVIKGDSLEKSKELAEESKELPSQALGQLRAPSNLRLTPAQEDGNILLLLDGQAVFEIVDWDYKPKQKSEEDKTSDDIKAAEEGQNKVEKLDDKYDIWYKVRLDPSVSPAPMGWVYGRQVDLRVPSDIVYYQTNNRKFVTWQSLDTNKVANDEEAVPDSTVKVTKPGSWVILSRTNDVKAIDGQEPDFDGILVLGFDKYNEEHYTAFSTTREKVDVWGMLPLKIEGTGDNKSFTVNLRNFKTGKMEEKQFVLHRDTKKRLRVTPPPDLKDLGKESTNEE